MLYTALSTTFLLGIVKNTERHFFNNHRQSPSIHKLNSSTLNPFNRDVLKFRYVFKQRNSTHGMIRYKSVSFLMYKHTIIHLYFIAIKKYKNATALFSTIAFSSTLPSVFFVLRRLCLSPHFHALRQDDKSAQ